MNLEALPLSNPIAFIFQEPEGTREDVDEADFAASMETSSLGRRPHTWHLSQLSSNASFSVSAQAVEHTRRSLAGYRGRVDLTPLVGTQIGLKRSAICQILGCEEATLDRLLKLKLLRRHPESNRGVGQFYWFDPGWTMGEIHDRWVQTKLKRPASHRDFKHYREIRNACRIGADEPIPKMVFDAAVEFLAQLGSTDFAEINAFLPLGAHAIQRCQEVRRALDVHWRLRASTDLPKIDRAAVLAAFPELAEAKLTNLQAVLGHERPAPAPEALGRAWLLGPLRRATILMLHIMAGKGKGRDEQIPVVKAFELLDEVFTAMAPDGDPLNADTMDLVLGTLAFGDLPTKVRSSVREEAARTIAISIAWLRRWNRSTGENRFEDFNLAQVSERSTFLAELRAVYGHLRTANQAERLRRTSEAANRFVAIQEMAFMRKEGLCDTAAVARRAVAEIGDAPCVKFSVFDRVMAPNGTLLSGAQRNDWIAWRRPHTGDDLPDASADIGSFAIAVADAAHSDMEMPTTAPANAEDGVDEWVDDLLFEIDLDDFIFEFVGCEAVIGVEAFDPWYVTCAEHGTWTAPALLDADMQERRHQLIRDWKLPTYPSTPAGLLRFGTSDSALFRRMAAKGRTIFPLGKFEIAMRIAHVCFRAVVESFCRSGEFRQLMHSLSKWPTKSEDGRTIFKFLAFRKSTDDDGKPTVLDEFDVSEQTHDEGFELAELIIARNHADVGELPDIAPPTSIEWKCPPGPYIISWRGKAIQLSALLVFLRYLLANTGEQFGFHDFRFASAKDAKMVGLPMIMIQSMLKHAFPGITEYYASLTPELVASRTEEDLARRRAEQARRSTYRLAA